MEYYNIIFNKKKNAHWWRLLLNYLIIYVIGFSTGRLFITYHSLYAVILAQLFQEYYFLI